MQYFNRFIIQKYLSAFYPDPFNFPRNTLSIWQLSYPFYQSIYIGELHNQDIYRLCFHNK